MHSNNYEPAPDQELIPLDLEKTAQLLIQAADLGDAEAQFNLGMAYGAGRGVPADTDRALVLVTLAATQGLAAAQFSLAAMYMNGKQLELYLDGCMRASWEVMSQFRAVENKVRMCI